MFIKRVIKSLEKHGVKYAIVGGYAVALHGVIRGTVDLDLVIALDEAAFTAAEQALTAVGLQPRLPVTASEVFHFRQEYIERRNLLAWSFHNPANPLEVVDILITEDAAGMDVVDKQAFGLTLKVAAIPELIRIKRQAGRPQDEEDIRALEKML
jgi:hypothetical protein